VARNHLLSVSGDERLSAVFSTPNLSSRDRIGHRHGQDMNFHELRIWSICYWQQGRVFALDNLFTQFNSIQFNSLRSIGCKEIFLQIPSNKGAHSERIAASQP
jgi:hypothetical protein